MKTVWSLCAGAVLVVLIVARPALAEEGWLGKLNPFAKKEKKEQPRTTWGGTYTPRKAKPSPLEKLGTGTKKFFAGARDVLTGKKHAPKRKPANHYTPWTRQSTDWRHTSSRKKQSWFDSLFRREEPKPVESMEDWVGLPRLEP